MEVRGGSGNDVLNGVGGNDKFWGGGGDDVLRGGSGVDYLDGGDGVDMVFYGGSGSGVYVDLEKESGMRGDARDDMIVNIENVLGSMYGDRLKGNESDNWLVGGGGDDGLWGRDGDDVLWGDGGNDRVWGGAGDDRLLGGDGVDGLKGEAGDDWLDGGDGDDFLDGGLGNDELFGGSGDDVFSFGSGYGDDVINDFEDGVDLINLIGFCLSGFDELVIFSYFGSVMINWPVGGGMLELKGFDLVDLSVEDFWSSPDLDLFCEYQM